MFKPVIPLLGLLMIALFTKSSRCQKEDDVAPEFTSLIGKWQLLHYTIEGVRLNGEEVFILDEFKKNGNVLFWEFFDNGVMRASEAGSTPADANWELKVEQLVGLNINKGQLILTGSYAEQVKTALELDELVYFIETSSETGTMNLLVHPNNLSAIYSSVSIAYVYEKI